MWRWIQGLWSASCSLAEDRDAMASWLWLQYWSCVLLMFFLDVFDDVFCWWLFIVSDVFLNVFDDVFCWCLLLFWIVFVLMFFNDVMMLWCCICQGPIWWNLCTLDALPWTLFASAAVTWLRQLACRCFFQDHRPHDLRLHYPNALQGEKRKRKTLLQLQLMKLVPGGWKRCCSRDFEMRKNHMSIIFQS